MAASKSQIPWVRYWDKDALTTLPPDDFEFQVDDACMSALGTLNPSGERSAAKGHFGGNPLACNPDEHADASFIRDWLASIHRDPADLQVIFWLAYFVRNEWANFPKRTNSENRELYQRIAKLCDELRGAMDETGLPYSDGNGGLQGVSIYQMLTDFEIDCVVAACDCARRLEDIPPDLDAAQRRTMGKMLSLPGAELPTIGTLLERVAAEARQLDSLGPLHSQPNKRGAERGYFVRRTGTLFERRYGEQPHEVIAALTTIALGEATDRELVAKLLAPRTL